MGGSGWNGVSRKEENERLWKKGKVGQHRKFVSSRERPRSPTGPSADWEGRAGKLCEPITNSSCGTNSFCLRAFRSGALLLRVALTCWWDWRSLVSVVLRNKWRKKNIWQNAHPLCYSDCFPWMGKNSSPATSSLGFVFFSWRNKSPIRIDLSACNRLQRRFEIMSGVT